MNLKRVDILLGKEFIHGPKNFIFIWAFVVPIILTLFISLTLGTLFSGKPRLRIVDEGSSGLVAMTGKLTSVLFREYASVFDMKQAVASGALDTGAVLPDNFDSSVMTGERTKTTTYIWGESPLWNDWLLPLIVLMAVFVGGIILPASSLINEKVKKTLEAVGVTPATTGDVFIAKGLLGIILSLLMGVLILILNQAFGAEPGLLILVLALGAVMAVGLGLLLGAVVKDITTFFAVWKLGGILLFGPAIVYMFPKIPEWIGRIFPTYYLVQPSVEISQRGAGWSGIAANVFILIALDLIMILIMMLVLSKVKQKQPAI